MVEQHSDCYSRAETEGSGPEFHQVSHTPPTTSFYLVHWDVMNDDTILAQWPLTMGFKQYVSLQIFCAV